MAHFGHNREYNAVKRGIIETSTSRGISDLGSVANEGCDIVFETRRFDDITICLICPGFFSHVFF